MAILDRKVFEEIGEPFEGSTALAMADFDVHYWIYRNSEDISETRQRRVREFKNQRRIKPSHANNRRRGAGSGGTRREPLMSEKIDFNHRATPPHKTKIHMSTASLSGTNVFFTQSSIIPTVSSTQFQASNQSYSQLSHDIDTEPELCDDKILSVNEDTAVSKGMSN